MTWQDQGECRSLPPEIFFPLDEVDGELLGDDGTIGAPIELYDEAKAVCRVCPVRSTCLDWALDNKERYGIWGELTPIERLRIERKHRRRRLLDRRANEVPDEDS